MNNKQLINLSIIKFPTFIITLSFLLSISLIYGLGKIFNKVLCNNLSDAFVFLTLPLVIGAVLDKEYKTEKNLFIASSAFSMLSIGFMASLGSNPVANLVLLILFYLGIFFFSFGLFRLALKSLIELKVDLFNSFKKK